MTYLDGPIDELPHAGLVPDVHRNGRRAAAGLDDLPLDRADGGLRGVGVRRERRGGAPGVARRLGRYDDFGGGAEKVSLVIRGFGNYLRSGLTGVPVLRQVDGDLSPDAPRGADD